MQRETAKQAWQKEEGQAFAGWDFSYLKDRWHSAGCDFDYAAIVRGCLHPADQLLDMGTGGGEVLLSLSHPCQNTSVTEAWPPNIALCQRKLAPLGIRVHPVSDDGRLPMAVNTFDIVINRHESYDLAEVARVLKPGGLFITQQVGGQNCARLNECVNIPPLPHTPFSPETEAPQLKAHGFSVEHVDESFSELKFFDVGAIVFFVKQIPWHFPDFSVERNFEKLLALEEAVTRDGCFADAEHRFIIVARNRGGTQ